MKEAYPKTGAVDVAHGHIGDQAHRLVEGTLLETRPAHDDMTTLKRILWVWDSRYGEV